MKISRWIVLISLIISINILHSEDIYTTGMSVKNIDGKIKIEWGANTNEGLFYIYRNSQTPVYSLSVLSNSLKIAVTNSVGVKEKSLFKYTITIDPMGEEGSFYFAVLPMLNKIQEDDLRPELNYMIHPVTISNMEIKEGFFTVKNIFIKTNIGQAIIFWDIDEGDEQNIKFSIYRTTNLITDTQLLHQIAPYGEVNNEYYIEDDNLKYGVPYYYTIIANDFKIIKPGRNQNTEPVIFGFTNIIVKVEKEVLSKTNISTEEYLKKFKK